MFDRPYAYLRYLKDEGVCHALSRFFKAIIGILCQNKIMYFYRLDLLQLIAPSDRFLCQDTALKVKEATVDDIPRIVVTMYTPVIELLRRFKEGQRCFVAIQAKDISGYLWITAKDEYIPDIELMYDVPQNSMYIYNVRTKKKFRGKGIFSVLLGNVCQILRSEGFLEVYSAILANNIVSIRGFEKCGFVKYRKIIFRKRLGNL